MVGCSGGLKLLTVFNYARRRTSKHIRKPTSDQNAVSDRRSIVVTPDHMHRPCRRQLITLPNDILLEIFDLYVQQDELRRIQDWIRLAHVCRRWRSVVFQSPHRLNLQLVCPLITPTSDFLDIWPPLPLVIRNSERYFAKPFKLDNIIAALEHNDRICEIQLMYVELGYFTHSEAMQKPFPELTYLWLIDLDRNEEPEPLPDSFLGGSVPRLRSIEWEKIPFPGLSKLLLSTTHLVNLQLTRVPRSGYITSEVMADTLSALTSLELLSLQFDYPPPRLAIETRRQPRPRHTRSILPSLALILFKGASEYLEVILARVDAPRLDKLDIIFFNKLIFDTPQLTQFISRRPTLRALKEGHIIFYTDAILVKSPLRTTGHHVLRVRIPCTPSDWQLSSLEQVCASLPPISTLKDLYISEHLNHRPHWQDDVENTQWLDLLRSFVAVKNLYISVKFGPRVVPALQELVGERTTEVLPALENIFIENFQPSGPLREGMEKFVAARLLVGRPVTVSHSKEGFHEW